MPTFITGSSNPILTEIKGLNQSIDTKLDALVDIRTDLAELQTTLDSVATDTSAMDTKLADVLTKMDTEITALGDIKTELQTSNVNLTDIKTKLDTLQTTSASIVTELQGIKSDTTLLITGVAAVDASINAMSTALSTKLETLDASIGTLNTTLQAESDETQQAIADLQAAVELTQSTFQVKDCAGVDVGTPLNVQQSIVVNKITTEICNTADVSDPIVAAIEASAASGSAGLSNDVNTTPLMAINDTITVTGLKGFDIQVLSGSFSIISAEDHTTNIVLSAGAWTTNILANPLTITSFEDLATSNSYTITSLEADSVLKISTYK